MSEPAAASASATPAKKVTKKKVTKPAEHPKYKDMIRAAIESLKERNGSSRQAISKYLKANYKVGDSVDVHIKTELKRLVASGDIVHTKGTGASGSFKVAKKSVEPKKKTATKKKPAAAKIKKVAKKPAAKKAPAKKPAAKKTAAKKAPKKKPVAKKSPKKTTKKKPASKKPTKK